MNDPSVVLVLMRLVAGGRGKDVAEAEGVTPGWISTAESGKKGPPSRDTLRRRAEGLGLPDSFVDRALALVREGRAAIVAHRAPADPHAAARHAMEQLAGEAGHASSQFLRASMELLATQAEVERAKSMARETWDAISAHPPSRRRALLDAIPEAKTPALCALVCEESVKAAANEASQAVELADLALWISDGIEGEDKPVAQGYAWAFMGNARRVQGAKLPAADEAFHRHRALWIEPTGPSPFDPSRVLDLEASLRRDQRRIPEALALLDRALAVAQGPPSTARILIIKAKTFEEAGDYATAVETLRVAEPLIDAGGDPQLHFALRFNLPVNLCHLGRAAEAEPMLSEVRSLAVRGRNALSLVRLRWLEGRVAAGLGRRGEAIDLLTRVRGEFASRGIAYDMALVSLELAELYAVEGRMDAVRSLARHMAEVFKDQEVHAEAKKALAFFRRAAERDSVTPELAGQVVRYLYRARHQPELRFVAA